MNHFLTFDTTSLEAESRSRINECLMKPYRDLSNETEDSYLRGRTNQLSSISKGGVSAPFPYKLFDLLERIDTVEPELSYIISWLPHGRSFLVHEPNEFTKFVLPRFFNQKYASFQRQLNLYGFSRITRHGADKHSYYHECFLRSKRFLCRGIIRIKINGSGGRRPGNPESDPNFKAMHPLPKSCTTPDREPAPNPTTSDDVDSSASKFQEEVNCESNEAIFNGMPFRPITSRDEEVDTGRRRRHSFMDPTSSPSRRSSLQRKKKNVWAELADHLS